MSKTSVLLIISVVFFGCKDVSNGEAKREYLDTVIRLRQMQQQELPFVLSTYLNGRLNEIVWTEHVIDEDSARTKRYKVDLNNLFHNEDSLIAQSDSLFNLAYEPGSEDYKIEMINRESYSSKAEFLVVQAHSKWEGQMMSDLLLNGYKVKEAFELIDSVGRLDVFGGNPPEWFDKHKKSMLKRYQKEFGKDFQ